MRSLIKLIEAATWVAPLHRGGFEDHAAAAIRVYRNPSSTEYTALSTALQEDEGVRFLLQWSSGDLYIWDGYGGTHDAVFNGLYLPGDIWSGYSFGHIRPGKDKTPVVECDAANFLPDELRQNTHFHRLLGRRFRVVEID